MTGTQPNFKQALTLPDYPVTFRNAVALAPMAGMTDVPLRSLAWQFGAGHMVSEMVTSKAQLWDTGKSKQRRVLIPGVTHHAVQIAGKEPTVMAESAQRLVDEGVGIIDVNFGCPAKKVCRKAAGSALLADIDRVARIVDAVASAVDVPVTVKTRTGLTLEDSAGLDAALAAQKAGAQMIVIHGRSRACRFNGAADYSKVAKAKEQLLIPVLVNGDIDGPVQAQRACLESGADGVMIGRAVMGQPWIFAMMLGAAEPTRAEKLAVMQRHLVMLHEFYGEVQGPRIARKHVQAYLQRLHRADLVPAFMRLASAQEQCEWLATQCDNQLFQSRAATHASTREAGCKQNQWAAASAHDYAA